MNYKEIAKETIGYLYQSHSSIRQSEIDNKLIALAELRVSQLNGCAFCCSFHASELREMGITQNLLDKIPGYKHSQSFNKEQELGLRYADAITHLSADVVKIRQELAEHITEKQLVELTASISLMNALNRLRIVLGEKF